ncbi:MAG: PTS beta-glucoside transporter subunit IIB [Coprobacillus sp.]
MLIYVCCAGGITSSLFASKIKDAATQNNVAITDIFTAMKEPELEETHDFVLAYGPIELFSHNRANNFIKEIDIILICPQVRYLEENTKKAVFRYNPDCYISSLDIKLFGTMDGAKVFENLLTIIDSIKKS